MSFHVTIDKEQPIEPFLPCMDIMAEPDTSLPEVEEIKGSSSAYGARYMLKDKDGSVRKVYLDEKFTTIDGKNKTIIDLSPEELFCYVDYDVERDGHSISSPAIRDENLKLIPVSYEDRCALHAYFSKNPKMIVRGFDPVKDKPEIPYPFKKTAKGPQNNLH
ncbi:MAG: hypothetical protein PHX43_02210 [Alphaproteobacteria bacterium]|nr:hypothetical protein [Alphaproteobacteria bacterium]